MLNEQPKKQTIDATAGLSMNSNLPFEQQQQRPPSQQQPQQQTLSPNPSFNLAMGGEDIGGALNFDHFSSIGKLNLHGPLPTPLDK